MNIDIISGGPKKGKKKKKKRATKNKLFLFGVQNSYKLEIPSFEGFTITQFSIICQNFKA